MLNLVSYTMDHMLRFFTPIPLAQSGSMVEFLLRVVYWVTIPFCWWSQNSDQVHHHDTPIIARPRCSPWRTPWLRRRLRQSLFTTWPAPVCSEDKKSRVFLISKWLFLWLHRGKEIHQLTPLKLWIVNCLHEGPNSAFDSIPANLPMISQSTNSDAAGLAVLQRRLH